MPPEQEYTKREQESKSTANEEVREQSYRSTLKTMAPPPFQLKPQSVIQEKEEKGKGKNEVKDGYEFSGGSIDPPPSDDNNKPFQLKSENSSTGMSNKVQNQMENSFDRDFSNVNIHKDSNKAKDVGALAYTQGTDVHFAPGQFQPETSKGQELIGHELTHVVQQSEGRVKPTTQTKGIPVNDDKGLEKEADVMGKKATQMKADPSAGHNKADTSMMTTQTIQRWEWPSWLGGGGSKAKGGGKGKTAGKAKGGSKDKKDKSKDLKKVKVLNKGKKTGTNFDSSVSLPGPLPAAGKLQVDMNIRLKFQDCNMANIKKHATLDKENFKTLDKHIKAAQKKAPASLKWDAKSKSKFQKDYQKTISNTWSSKGTKWVFKLNDKEYEKYQVSNNIKLNFSEKNFGKGKTTHHTINAMKMLPTMPRLRSYHWTESMFDSRDVSKDTKQKVSINYLAEQIGPFKTASSRISPEIQTKIDKFISKSKKIMDAHKKDTPKPSWAVSVRGRSSTPGLKRSNKRLSKRRAEKVGDKIFNKLNTTLYTGATGEKNSEKDSKYQRVEVILHDDNEKQIKQSVAAHETGHMFGLGDEYPDEVTEGVLKKSTGDDADETTQAMERAGMSKDMINEHRINQHNDSIMHSGSKVMQGHYSVFLNDLKSLAVDDKTGKQVNWQVLKG